MAEPDQKPCCCPGPAPVPPEDVCCIRKEADAGRDPARPSHAAWIVGSVRAGDAEVPQISNTLRLPDRIGAWKARWGIGRMQYRVEPGLYAAGQPTADSPVLISASYRMSFDRLRSQLGDIDAWVLVLDTDGINVWCAAGKGTFGTEELIRRMDVTNLSGVVSHRTIIVPQLGAPGVAAHEVRKRGSFKVVYGPIRAEDLPAFLDSGMKATPEMRRVRFSLADRLAVVPVELMVSAKYVFLIMAAFFILSGLGPDGYSPARVFIDGTWSAFLILAAFAGGTLFGPALLPWLPGRALALKGVWIGMAVLLVVAGLAWMRPEKIDGEFAIAGWCLMIPTITSFVTMNFSGSTTYTSLSGVRREMRVAVPIQAVAAVAGVVLWLVGRFAY